MSSVLRWLPYVILLQISKIYIDAQSYDNIRALRKNLLIGYDRGVVPVLNQSHFINITTLFSLIAIPEVNTVNSFMKLRAFMYLFWIDEKLTWDPADYGGIQEISLPVEKVWTPQMILVSGVTLENIVNSWKNVYIGHDGFTSVSIGGTFSSLCNFTMKFWPFDMQTCNLHFFPLYSGREMKNFVFPSNPVDETEFRQMGEWTYDQTSVFYGDLLGGRHIIYSVKVRRQSAFYLLTIILPLYTVSFLGLLVFLMPCESGERVGFSITILLSIAVFMIVIKDELPKSSEPLPYMCIFINAAVFFGFLLCIINIYILNLFHRNEAQPVGRKYKRFVNLVYSFIRHRVPEGMANNKKDEIPSCSRRMSEETSNDLLTTKGEEQTRQVKKDLVTEKEVGQDNSVTWKDISNVIDKIVFVTVAPTALLVTVVCVVYLKVASDYQE